MEIASPRRNCRINTPKLRLVLAEETAGVDSLLVGLVLYETFPGRTTQFIV